jgi:GDP-mannose 6-dehydrogenase|tara:strand:+ start:5216 stop:5995 length:780 start_codon:yes stop_codon:yes gene_type:complete
MKLGIIGRGVVGTAIQKGFEKINHSVRYHDIKHDTKIEDVLGTEIIYICVGTPSTDLESCDISAVLSVVDQLNVLEYKGIVVIKSTVEPGTTQELVDKYTNLTFAFVPEFLRERCAYEDFVYNNSILVVGTEDEEVYKKIVESHGVLPTHTMKLSIIEAELMKYFSNTYKAMRITFANSFYKIADHYGANYNAIKDAFLFHAVEEGHYLRVDKDFGYGYGGMCLPKDTKAMKRLVEKLDIDVDIFKFIDKENDKFKKMN